jgi:hypothetical protein
MATDLLAYIAVQGWIAWVPRRRVPVLTRAGAYSLYAYLLHPCVVWFCPPLYRAVLHIAAWAGGEHLELDVSRTVLIEAPCSQLTTTLSRDC